MNTVEDIDIIGEVHEEYPLDIYCFIGSNIYWNRIILYIHGKQPQYVEEGVLDFQTLGWPEKGYMELNGEWEFYFNEFIEPGDFEGKEPRYIKVPGIWNRDVRGEKYPVKGFGTYRLVLKNFPTDEVIALKKTSIRNASRIFIN